MEVMHQRKVEKCWTSASNHKADDRSWSKRKKMRGCWTVVKQKRKEWSKHWQCDDEVQSTQDKPWRNEELRKGEDALPRLKEGDLENASRLYKATTRKFPWT